MEIIFIITTAVIIATAISVTVVHRGIPWVFTYKIMYNPDGTKYIYIEEDVIITYNKDSKKFTLLDSGIEVGHTYKNMHSSMMGVVNYLQISYSSEINKKEYNKLE